MFAKKCLHWIITPFILAGLVYFVIDLSPFRLCWLWPIFILIGIFFMIFFRDPEREVGKGIVAAADGVIREISDDGQHLNISTFMNVHNVHVNRAPISGKVIGIERVPGSFKPAFSSDANENSRVNIDMETDIGKVRIIQISGVFAYRIVPYISVGQTVEKGDRIGIIRFGSRVDVLFPSGKVKPAVKNGQKVLANITTLAESMKEGE
ncbi:MAG: phosphatidylserine decarboxylase [Thermoplasmata archaeon]|nr:phosphatidylserine decarboxylase [Thermoplasmata archaeon]